MDLEALAPSRLSLPLATKPGEWGRQMLAEEADDH